VGKVTRRAALGAAGAVVAAAVGVRLSADDEAPPLADWLFAGRIEGPLPVDDPGDGRWSEGEIRVPLLPQNAAAPGKAAVSVPELTVSALHDGSELGLRMTWTDPDCDDRLALARYQDAVAVQLPARAGTRPPVTMGGPGAPVHLLQWRAAWQRQLEDGGAGVEAIYPRVVRDLDATELLGERAGALWSPGRAVGNPMSARERATAVEEAVAEGFGSLTHLPRQRARGLGAWADGGWRVCIALPLDRRPEADPIRPGVAVPVAFAVWAGGAGDRGGRKQYADWINLQLAA